ncbi:MAG: ATP-grasp domain-containing protein [Methanomassiliicoccales archaeon]
MNLKEYEGKTLFKKFGIPTTDGYVVRSPSDIKEISGPMVVKAQIEAGGRGKSGGIRFASTLEQLKKAVEEIIGMEIAGQKVEEVLVENRVNIDREFYLAFLNDRKNRLPKLIMLRQGGIDVENSDPFMLMEWTIDPLIGVSDYICREAAMELVLDPGAASQLKELIQKAWRMFWEMDCELLEINPVALSHEGNIVALDSKITIDDDALFRQTNIKRKIEKVESLEAEARAIGMSLVRLEGEIAVIANGAGLTMATLDVLALYGEKGLIFLDLGGTDDEKAIEQAIQLANRAGPKVILINIFGSVTKCDTVAEGVIGAKSKLGVGSKFVVRLRGTNEEKARQMLESEGIITVKNLEEACLKAVQIKGD